jgi:hypothetical protein
MDLAAFLINNGVENQTAGYISAAVRQVTHHDTVNTLQFLTMQQVGEMKKYLTPGDFTIFKEFHYTYLLEYNKELRHSMREITRSIEDLHSGNNRIPVSLWNGFNAHNVAS